MEYWNPYRGPVTHDSDHHPGIALHKIPVDGGFIGLVFTIGSIVIFVGGFPTFWYVIVLSIVLGIAIAILLRLVNSKKSKEPSTFLHLLS